VATAHTAELAELIRPFVGAKRVGAPKLNASIDIRWGAQGGLSAVNATVAAVTDEGVERSWDGQRQPVLPWASIHSITIKRLDDRGEIIGRVTFEHVGAAPAMAA